MSSAKTLSVTDRIDLWLICRGIDLDLYSDLISYFAVCCTFGLLKGLGMGAQIAQALAR